jgi:hypothetical protein
MLFVAVTIAAAMLFSPEALRSALATSASALFEATPFALAGALLARLVRWPAAMTYFGCGCGCGPSARSLPATAVTWLAFGPIVAIARFLAAVAVARLPFFTRRSSTPCDADDRLAPALLGELASLLPASLIAGAAMQTTASVDVAQVAPSLQIAGGALLAFVTAPCGIGAVAVAASLHGRAPLAAVAFLCVVGIADLRAFARQRSVCAQSHDALAYAMLALALGIVGWRGGGALVHPILGGALTGSCAVVLGLAALHRRRQSARLRLAPAFMLIGALVAAPPPVYRATETTMNDLFAGERLTFTGSLTRNANAAAVVRYAITCCRADAVPVAVALAQPPPFPTGTWLRVDGTIAIGAGGPRLVARRIERVAPPTDPFVYR